MKMNNVSFDPQPEIMSDPETRGIHIGIIPDGSRRWAMKNNIKDYNGDQSRQVVERTLEHIFNNHPEVDVISIWALSVDNLKRSDPDKILVYDLLEKGMRDLMVHPVVQEKGVKVNLIGSNWGDIPQQVKEVAKELEEKTKDNKGRVLNLCIGYGGRQEILDAVMSSMKWLRKNPRVAKLHEKVFERHLMIPRPLDVVIRTGGEKRLSGFMLYQIEYAELFFIDTLWPEFSLGELDSILREFSARDRRFGK
ncbi:MAG: polyprenyl diphosphate synthase [Thermodesulfobacteriota bacterium]|jgi:undecaprenyl diphosphate synthase